MIDFHKKEEPFQGVTGWGGGATGLRMSSAATKKYIDDVFSMYTYRGNASGTGTDHQIVNGIDNSTEGGMVWIKNRNQAVSSLLFDTVRTDGGQAEIKSDSQQAQQGPYTDYNIKTFNTDGYTLTGNGGNTNENNKIYMSWNFRKCEKFFDIVTYTGNGTGGRTVSHNLKSTPGVVLVKNLTDSQNWVMYHRSVGNTGALLLDDTGAITTSTSYWNDTSPTNAVFTVGTDNMMNGDGKSYVAYIFAHEEEVFGPDSDKKIISCGTYAGTGSPGVSVTTGFEPAWVMVKNMSTTASWYLMDTLRSMPVDDDDEVYQPNSNAADQNWGVNFINPLADGFTVETTGNTETNASGNNYAYIAIAAHSGALMNPDNITAGTQVFAPVTGNGWSAPPEGSNVTNFVVDYMFQKNTSSSSAPGYAASRKSGRKYVRVDHSATATTSSDYQWDSNIGMGNAFGNPSWLWRRHSGFDIMSYNGDNTIRTSPHNLGGVPEFMIFKNMDAGHDWMCWHKDLNGGVNAGQYFMVGNSTNAAGTSSDPFNSTAPTATHVTLGNGSQANGTGEQIIGMLFRSVSGISKVGSYTVTDDSVDKVVDVGFAPRFVLIKCRNAAGTNWIITDTNRGSSDGNTPLYFLNSDAAQGYATQMYYSGNTFVIKHDTAGGQLFSGGNHYIYYAHA